MTTLLAAVAAVALLAAGCGDSRPSQAGSTSAADASAHASAHEAIPFESLTDWVSYGTAVAAIRVVSEDDTPPEYGDDGDDVVVVGRIVTIEVETVIWGEGPATGRASFITDTYVEKKGKAGRARLAPEHGSRLEVGRRYVAALMRNESIHSVVPDDGGWSLLNSGSVIPLKANVLAPDPATAVEPAMALAGLTVDELRARLTDTAPDPLAVEFAHLEPLERALRVGEERQERTGNRGTPAPGELR